MTGSSLKHAGRILARVPVSIGRGFAGFWRSLSVIARRRLAAAGGVAVVLLVLFALVVPNLPCAFPGGDSCPPADDAAAVVPADALAYAHANLDPDTDQFAAAAEVGEQLPLISGQLADRALALVRAPGAEPLDFERDIRPWFGGEVAIAALTGAGRSAELVQLLEVEDAEGAGTYAEALATGQVQTTEYEGVEVSVDQRDVASAQVQGFLVIGTEIGVRAVIATATGADGAEALADDSTAREVRDELPEHRFAEAWISEAGLDELVAGDRGTLGTLSPLLAPGAGRGAAVSLSADEDDELELAVRSALDPDRAESSPGFFAAFPAFEPELPERLAPATLAYLGMGAPAQAVTALLRQASSQAPGIARAFRRLVERLRRSEDVDIQEQLVDALGGEAAVALEPPAAQAGVPTTALPYAMFVAAGVDEEPAREALAALQRPLAAGVEPGEDGQAPVFGQEEVGGVEVNTLRASPVLELTYAVFDGLVAVATDSEGIGRLIGGEGGLDETEAFEAATEDFPDEVSLLAYLDLGGLVTAGEQAGLAEDPLYATFAGEFRRLDTLGLAIASSDELLATDARLALSDAQEPQPEPPVVAPGD